MKHSRRAFTLLELMLVLAIMIAAAGLVMPSLFQTMQQQQVKHAADQLRAQCGLARVEAMRSGQIQMLRVEINGSKYYVQPWSLGDEALNASDKEALKAIQTTGLTTQPNERKLPEGVTFVSSESPFDTRSATVEETLLKFENGASKFSRPILFYPDGTSSAVEIVVANAREQAVQVKLRSLTGLCKVGEVSTVSALGEKTP